MVPHLRIEEAIQKILGVEDEGELKRRRHLRAGRTQRRTAGRRPHAARQCRPRKSAAGSPPSGLPNLWIPDADSFLEVEAIPVLGSGKTDLKALSDLAKRHFGEAA